MMRQHERAAPCAETAPSNRARPHAPGSQVLGLQRLAGNNAVATVLRQAPEEPTGAGPGAGAPTASGSAMQEQRGTISDLEGQEFLKEDHGGGPLAALAPSLPKTPGGVRIRPHITMEVRAREHDDEDGGGKSDSISSSIGFGSRVVQSATPGSSEFGVERVKYKVDRISWIYLPFLSTVYVYARVFLDITWGVHSLGRTDISGALDYDVITASNATKKKIAKDLRPDASGRPTRASYWARDLTARHERFHASDDIGRAKLYLPTARSWLGAQTVSPSSVGADVAAHLETMRANIEADGWAWYGTGGESRAYADGKASYESRADAIDLMASVGSMFP